MKKQILFSIIALTLLITGCNSEMGEKNTHSLEVYGTVSEPSGVRERLSTPIFTEKDIEAIDLEEFKFYFTEDYLKAFDIQNIVDEYNDNPITVDGLRIFSFDSGNGFEFVLDGEMLFLGEYSQGRASSHFPIGYVMYDEGDGIRIEFIELSDSNANDMRKDSRLLDAFENLGFM